VTPQILVGLLLATGCAVATNVASVLKHRGANAVPPLRIRTPLRSLRLLLGSRWFALGFGLALLAGVMHIAALALAPMSVVQVVLAAGVVLLAGLATRLLGCVVPLRQRIGLFAAAAGLALLVVCGPHLQGAHSSFGWRTLVGFEALVAAAGLVLACGPRHRRLLHHRGVLLGAAGGAFFGLSDVAVKAITGLAGHGAAATAIAPWLTIALTGGIAAQVFAVRGLQEGEAVPVIALTGVTANIANIAGGVLVFGDPLAHGPVAWTGQTLAFVLVVFGSALVPSSGASVTETAPSIPALKAA
jgi:drug/metabolite transporter (DMT)-like permease